MEKEQIIDFFGNIHNAIYDCECSLQSAQKTLAEFDRINNGNGFVFSFEVMSLIQVYAPLGGILWEASREVRKQLAERVTKLEDRLATLKTL